MIDEVRKVRGPRTDWVPGLSSLRRLEMAAVPTEIAAGVGIAAVAVPVSLALAALIGVPPVFGLYASIFPMLAYAIFGPSRFLVVGPDTATCVVVATILASFGWQDAGMRAVAASALALIAGIGFGLASFARLGFVTSLLSRPILVGYMGGVALTLLTSQIPSFTGVHVEARGLILSVAELATRISEINSLTLSLAVGCFLALLGMKILAPRLPGPAIVVGVAILLSWIFDLESHGVAVVGPLQAGLPAPSIPNVSGRVAEIGTSAIGLLLVSFVSGLVTVRSFGQKLGLNSDANLELRGFAAANVVAGLFHGFPVTGADSRTAVNVASGGKTALAPISASLFLAVVVATFTEPLALLPQAALGAVLATAALALVDIKAFRQLGRIGWQELVFAVVAMLGVIWVGVLQGVFLAIIVTFIHLLGLSARPRYSTMGSVTGQTAMVAIARHPGARPPSDGVVFIFEAALLFINADHFRERALAALDDTPSARWFVLDASAMPYADSSAVAELLDFQRTLENRGVQFAIAGGHGRFREVMDRAGVIEGLSSRVIHPTSRAAMLAMRRLCRSSATSVVSR